MEKTSPFCEGSWFQARRGVYLNCLKKVLSHESKIAVTVITGFLGAGKTTLINNLLKKYSGTRFALVENEYGDVAIDTQLIKGVDASQMFDLKQGCICCTINDEFELVLQELAERFSEVEYLLIETTGIADPAAVLEPFFRDKNLKETYELKETICLVDGVNFKDQQEREISLKQILVSDTILLNKTENFSIEQKESLQKEIEQINPLAKVECIVLGSADSIVLDKVGSVKQSTYSLVSLPGKHSKIQTKTLKFEKGLDKEMFLRWLSYTMDIHKREIYRVKGIIQFQNEPMEFILQGVGGSFELTEGEFILGDFVSTIVFIGKLEGVDFTF